MTKENISLGYEIFEGNKHDSKMVATIINKMEELYGQADRIWIMDRGMLSPQNLALLAQNHRRYIIGTPKNQLKAFEYELQQGDWKLVYEDLEVELCPSPEDNDDEVFILCRSTARQAKEKAIHDLFINRIETALRQLQKHCEKGRVESVEMAERHIGCLLERKRRAAKFFDITVKTNNGTVQLNWSIREKQKTWAQMSAGSYVLRSNVKKWKSENSFALCFQT